MHRAIPIWKLEKMRKLGTSGNESGNVNLRQTYVMDQFMSEFSFLLFLFHSFLDPIHSIQSRLYLKIKYLTKKYRFL